MARTTIVAVRGRRVWDSRGRPTVEAEVGLEGGTVARAIAPAGASMGSGEAVDKRDGGDSFGGLDVREAVAAVNGEIAALLVGRDADEQADIDLALIALDGTPAKGRLGGNALVATSMAALKAAAAARDMPLWRYLAGEQAVRIPLPQIQIFGGGAHAGGRVDIQDYLVVCPAAENFAQALDWTAEIWRAAGELLAAGGRRLGVADEGGHWPAFDSNEQGLQLLARAIERAGYRPMEQVAIALDIAASEFGRDGRYRLGLEGKTLATGDMVHLLHGWINRYPIVSIEDPLAEDDVPGFTAFTDAVRGRVQVVGDDFLVTNATKIEEAAAARRLTAALIKPNQAGTVSETRAATVVAKRAGLGTIVSARSGETEDTTIAHLAVGWDAGQFKVGSITRGERTAKWNEILRIEESMGAAAVFAGRTALGIA